MVYYYLAIRSTDLNFWNLARNPVWKLTTLLVGKILFVLAIFFYHLSLQKIFDEQKKGNFHWSSQKLRMWNELSTLFLFAIVMLAVIKELLNALWGFAGLIGLAIVLMIGIK